MNLDVGLLSPVRAGTQVEAATSDHAFLQAMLDAEAALVRAQARLGTVPTEAAACITERARAELLDARALALDARETANPVVPLVAALGRVVAAASPSAAAYVHRGSTSQDVLDTGLVLMAHRAREIVLADLRAVRERAMVLATQHRDTPQAARTLGLHAVPTTFGVKAAGWVRLVDDASVRLASVRLPVSVGGAAGTMAGYLEHAPDLVAELGVGGAAEALVEAVARETGLAPEPLPWHVVRTPFVDLAHACAFVTTALGKVAADVLVLTRTEVGELAEPGRPGRGASSAMPHKRNPVLATMLRSAAIQGPALASIVLSCVAAEDERPAGVWHAEWTPLREVVRLAGGSAATARELLEGLVVRPERMLENLHLSGACSTERVAARLVDVVGRESARRLVSAAVDAAAERGRPLRDEIEDLLGDVAPDLVEGLDDLLDPAAYVGAASHLAGLRPPDA